MLRAVIPLADLADVFSEESPEYLGESFPEMKEASPPCTLIEVVPDEEQRRWRAGFYRAVKGPLDFEEHLQGLRKADYGQHLSARRG